LQAREPRCARVAAHASAIEEKVRGSMRAILQKPIHACHGDDRPDCPDDIAGSAQAGDRPATV
jgi:hypothetical protein